MLTRCDVGSKRIPMPVSINIKYHNGNGIQSKAMDPLKFVMEAWEAQSMAESAGLTVQELLPTLVSAAQLMARPPISKYRVGAVGLGSSGRIFVGVNLEFPGLPLHHAVHAEQFLLTNLSLNAEPGLSAMAVSAAPCGHCRQFLQEVRGAGDVQIVVSSEAKKGGKALSEFLPNSFGPYELLHDGSPLLLEAHDNALTLTEEEEEESRKQQLKIGALEAANKSHAPYSGSPSGVALLDSDGNVYRGSYVESAAFNPSLGPLQAALVAFVAAASSPQYHRIVEAVLVEKDGAAIKQEDTARLLLNSISPHCQLTTFLCHSHPHPLYHQQ